MSTNSFDTLPQPLTEADEQALAGLIQDHAREEDINTLALHNMREAVLYAGRCCRGQLPEGELFSICYAALMKAAPRFKPGQGVRFVAYAKVDLRGEIARNWRTKDVVRSASLHETELPEIIRTSDTIEAEEVFSGEAITDYGTLEKEYAEPEFDLIAMRERWAIVEPLLHSALNERERTILQWTYQSGFTFEQIAALVVPKVTRSAIQSTHGRALRKIRNALLRTKQLYPSTI